MRQRKKEKEEGDSLPVKTDKQASSKPKSGRARRGFLIVLGILASLTILNRILLHYETLSLKNPGIVVNVGEYNLSMYCEGPLDSKQVVFLVPGSNTPYLPYTAVVKLLALNGTRACCYDRPQRLFSKGSLNILRGSHTFASDLHHLINLVKENRSSVVLVGHSLGGLISTTYAATYPEDVSALVLLDSAPTSIDKREYVPIGIAVYVTFYSLKLFSVLGLNRVASLFRPQSMWYYEVSPEHHALIDFYWNENNNIMVHEGDGVIDEMVPYLKTKIEEKKGAYLLNVPVKLIQAEKFGMPGCNNAWDTLWKHEAILTNLSAQTSSVTIANSDHAFPLVIPDVTAKYIQEVCDALP